MAWTLRGPHAGFSSGTPWQPLRTDSLEANVEAQDADSTSLLNAYRRLIHLRAAHPALATGTLLPLAASDDGVAAYLRRDGARAVLVLVNLRDTPVARVTVQSTGAVLPTGRYVLRDLLGAVPAAPLTVQPDGSVKGYVPGATLAPLSAAVFDLTRR